MPTPDPPQTGALASFPARGNGCGTEGRAESRREETIPTLSALLVIPHPGLTLLISRADAVVHRELVPGSDLHNKRVWGALL